ncbi:hypothetical protein SDC9_111783 [bioreactor metagenome]|uniref:Uncharacterized protein n=1 Tax=bioreactor metagenome TaxID=1076179 RepID=A0A645BI03_9ZZZZ
MAQGDAFGHQVGRQCGAAGHAHAAAPLGGHARHVEQGGIQLIKHARQPRGQAAPRLGQLHLARGAVHQLQAQL